MWKRPDPNDPATETPSTGTARQPSSSSPSAGPESRRSGERATIGPSISIKGDVTGEEDLLIQGRVEGKIDLKQHGVTVGRDGRVKADIFGRSLIIEGEVDGNLHGDEQIVVRQSGRVHGNISAPRVTLEDGCQFKGSIDMEPRAGERSRAGGFTATSSQGAKSNDPGKSEGGKPAGEKSPGGQG